MLVDRTDYFVVFSEGNCHPVGGVVSRECMLSLFIAKKLALARYKLLGDGSYFGMIPGLPGVWANGRTLERCREELREVLEDWLKLRGLPALLIRNAIVV